MFNKNQMKKKYLNNKFFLDLFIIQVAACFLFTSCTGKKMNDSRTINDQLVISHSRTAPLCNDVEAFETRHIGLYPENYNGKIKTCSEEGYAHWIVDVKNGKYDGEWVRYKDNRLESITEYKEGRPNGRVIRFHDNGNIQSIGTLINEKRHGQFRYYNKEGQMCSKDNWNMGKRQFE
jgi:antitoxin component YwqK of YwqJK toxin-antitoxin module